jgi:capsule polysaccharide export protein KpsC/LpsZ
MGYDQAKKNIFLFPNLYWDAAFDMIDTTKVVYSNVLDWVLGTVDMVKDDPNIVLYIKQHVREKWGTFTVKGVWDYVLEKYPTVPSNVRLVPAEWKINTYSLFPLINLGLVYTSTVGIEMLYKGLPLVIAGPAQYSGLGFAIEPTDRVQYEKALKSPRHDINIDRNMLELFCYYFFIKRLIRFNFTERVFSNNMFNRYLMDSLDDILQGKDRMLDHLCDCILYNKSICDY